MDKRKIKNITAIALILVMMVFDGYAVLNYGLTANLSWPMIISGCIIIATILNVPPYFIGSYGVRKLIDPTAKNFKEVMRIAKIATFIGIPIMIGVLVIILNIRINQITTKEANHEEALRIYGEYVEPNDGFTDNDSTDYQIYLDNKPAYNDYMLDVILTISPIITTFISLLVGLKLTEPYSEVLKRKMEEVQEVYLKDSLNYENASEDYKSKCEKAEAEVFNYSGLDEEILTRR